MQFEGRDLFGTLYKTPVTPYQGLDFSKKCFVFPGQGAATPGMGRELLQNSEILQKRFRIADKIATSAQLSLPSLYVESPHQISAENLSLTRSLALFTMSIGIFEILVANGERPGLLTGHSFGEYAALVAGGAVSFEEMFRVLIARELACAPAHQLGGMIAVSANAETIRKALKNLNVDSNVSGIYIGNLNSPQQTVLSVAQGQMKSTLSFLKKARLAAKALDSVAQPYHSKLMAATRENFEQRLSSMGSINCQASKIPILSSVSGEILSTDRFSILRALLADQLTSPVNFIAQIEKSVALGFRNFIEVSPLPIGGPWIREILKEERYKITLPNVLGVENTPALKKNLQTGHDSKLVNLLNKVISSVTGYSVVEISLSKNFQEDLGIDSIKKAQIVLNFLESQGGEAGSLQSGIVMNQIRTIEDVLTWYTGTQEKNAQKTHASFSLYKKAWCDTPLLKEMPSPSTEWISLQQACEMGQSLFKKIDFKINSAIIFYDDGGLFSLERWFSGFRASYAELQTIATEFTFVFVTDEKSSAESCGVEGFLRSLCKEVGCQFQAFQFDQFRKDRDLNLVVQELNSSRLETVRFQNGRRQILSFEPVSTSSAAEPPAPSSVAAIGGASGITFEILKSLAKRGSERFFIMGRRPEIDVQKNLNELRALGTTVQYIPGDCTRETELKNFIEKAWAETHKPLDLFIHGGGVEVSALVGAQLDRDLPAQTDVKIKTTQLLRDLNKTYPLRQVVCFSSTAGDFGNSGQAIYSYANVAMARECELAVRDGFHFSTLSWPAWSSFGMTEKESVAQLLQLSGLHLLEADKGCDLFSDFLAIKASNPIVCMDADFKKNQSLSQIRSGAPQSLFPLVKQLHFPVTLSNLNLRDLPALRDHFILDQSLVPVSYALALFWNLGRLMKGHSFQLTDIEALSFMVLHHRDSPYLLECQEDQSASTLEIRSNQPHVRGKITPLSETPAIYPNYVSPTNFMPVDMLRQGYMRFGPKFHLLEDVCVTDADIGYATVDIQKHSLYPANELMNKQLVLLESLFHLTGACSEAKTGQMSVPLSFASVVFNESVVTSERFRLVAHCRYPSENRLEADLYAYNENGEVSLAVRGERIRLYGSTRKKT